MPATFTIYYFGSRMRNQVWKMNATTSEIYFSLIILLKMVEKIIFGFEDDYESSRIVFYVENFTRTRFI